MKTAKRSLQTQRHILDKRLKDYHLTSKLLEMSPPKSGWLKAIRGALGLSANSLAKRIGCTPQSLLRMEKREVEQTVSLESLNKVAKAMNCRLVYLIVPEKGYDSYESIINHRAIKLSEKMVRGISHHMSLENQTVDDNTVKEEINKLALELKVKLDPKLWED